MLGKLSEEQLGGIVDECIGRSPLTLAHDPQQKARAIDMARRCGLLESIRQRLTPDQPIEAFRHSEYRAFLTTGQREPDDARRRRQRTQLQLAADACYLGDDQRAYLQDLLWATCETTWWVAAAHQEPNGPLDLLSTMMAAQLAEIVDLLGDRLDAEVVDRVTAEVRRRVLEPYLDPRYRHIWWRKNSNNWNAVCHGGVSTAAIILQNDPEKLTRTLATALSDMEIFVGGFTDDGGCTEGPGYWRYGFGWFMKIAERLHDWSAGRIDITGDPKIGRIARYPLATCVRPGVDLPFADYHGGGKLSPLLALRINRFFDVPELYALCPRNEDDTLKLSNLDEALRYDGRPVPATPPTGDKLLAELGTALLRTAEGKVALGAKAGHNGEHHNHNDVGSFVVYQEGTEFITDPGAPQYTARTFSPRRYEIALCNSFGHSVPVIDGQLQKPGREYGGTLSAEGLNEDTTRRLTIELAGAYDVPGLARCTRVLELPADGAELRLADTFVFDGPGHEVQEAFISKVPAAAAPDGRTVAIGDDASGVVTLAAESAGRFTVTDLTEQVADDAKTGTRLWRTAFTPGESAERMTLRFVVRL